MYREDLSAFIQECIRKGLPMPLNWTLPKNADNSEDNKEDKTSESAKQEKQLEDSGSPEAQESEQAEDDPEAKEVRDDCDSQTTEDCHGGQEATRSVEESPSVAENGQEDRDSDQTQNSGEDGEGTGKNGTETTGTGEENGGSDGTGSGNGDKIGTDSDTEENRDTSNQGLADEAANRDTAESEKRIASLRAILSEVKNFASAKVSYDIDSDAEKRTMQKIYDTIVSICRKESAKGVRNIQTTWDTEAIARDFACFRKDRMLHDKHWSYKPRRLAVFWDQSGSCDWCFAAIANAIKEVASLGYRCWLYDCSNGIMRDGSMVINKTKAGDTTHDYYNNGPRLRKIARKIGCNVDKNIISPGPEDFIKICQEFDTVIVLQDYDAIESIWLPAEDVEPEKCPYFIDLEEDRYEHPSEHDWNPYLREEDDWPVPDRWFKIRHM